MLSDGNPVLAVVIPNTWTLNKHMDVKWEVEKSQVKSAGLLHGNGEGIEGCVSKLRSHELGECCGAAQSQGKNMP